MKWIPHPFKSDRIKLSFLDILKLLLGFTIKDGACKISLWRIPKAYKGKENE